MESLKLRARLTVFAVTMRGRDVRIIYGADDKPPRIEDEDSGDVLNWRLSAAEQAELTDIITDHYQPAGYDNG